MGIYDDVEAAKAYDQNRFWEYDDPTNRVPLLARMLRLQKGTRLLDVGCGTGYYLERLIGRTECYGIGVDQSDAMVNVVRRRLPGLEVHKGCAEALPLSDATVEAVLCHHALHHFVNVPQFFREAMRVLVAAGRIAVVTVSHEQMRSHPLYRFFPEILAIDLGRVPDTDHVRAWLKEIGFAGVATQEVDRSSVGLSWNLVFEYVRRKFMSPMRLLPETEFEVAHRAFEERVLSSGVHTCPAESYSITAGVKR